MSISERTGLLLATGVLAAATAGWGMVLGRAAPHHFIPQQRMAAAVAAGGGCDVFFGDSRMDAAFDPAALHRGLASAGRDGCAVDLAIGATDIAGAYLTLRHYLAAGMKPARIVLGMAGDSLLDPAPLRPENAAGNNAIHLIWSQPGDVARELPALPGGGIGTWDAAFRFLVARATPIGRYESLLWSRVQQVDRKLAGATGASNRFGASGDMALLGAQLRRGAAGRIHAALEAPPLTGRWFDGFRELARGAGAALVVVELPMPGQYREAVTDSPEAARYRQLLADDIGAGGGAYVDFSHWAGAQEAAFMDDLHLGPTGAAAFSAALGSALGARQPDAAARK